MQCRLLLATKASQLQYNVEMLLLLWILYRFISIVTYCALFMLTFIILLLQITETLDKTLQKYYINFFFIMRY